MSESILNKLIRRSIKLLSVEAKALEIPRDSDSLEFDSHTDCVVKETDSENEYIVNATVKAFNEPAALFDMTFSYQITLKFGDYTTKEEVEENAPVLIGNIGSEVSYMIAVLTNEMFGTKIIVPPLMMQQDDD